MANESNPPVDPLSGVALTHQNVQIGMLFAWGGLAAVAAMLGYTAPPAAKIYAGALGFIAGQGFKATAKEVLAPLPWAPFFENINTVGRLIDNPFPFQLPPPVPLNFVPLGVILEQLESAGRLIDNPFPNGFIDEVIFDYTSPVSSLAGKMFASVMTDAEIQAVAPAPLNQFGMISDPVFAVNGGAPTSGPTVSINGTTYSSAAVAALGPGQAIGSIAPAFTAENGAITMSPNPDATGGIEGP